MQKARFVDWTVRFPLNMYGQVSSQILNECLTDTIHESLAGHRFQDVSFLVQEDCNKEAVLNALVETLNDIADRWQLENLHSYTNRVSTFEIDYLGKGTKELKFV